MIEETLQALLKVKRDILPGHEPFFDRFGDFGLCLLDFLFFPLGLSGFLLSWEVGSSLSRAYKLVAGAATAGINYISDLTGQNPGWGGPDAGFLTGMAGKLVSPYGGVVRDPGRECGSASPFVTVPGYGSSKGYRYDVPKAGGASRKQRKKFSLKEFLRETAAGGITGGVASAGVYGAGKGIERLKAGFKSGKGSLKEGLIHRYTLDGKHILM